jgi:putative transcriptional regulator
MKKDLFDELTKSVKEAKDIMKEKAMPSRVFDFSNIDIKNIREQHELSQHKFASLLGISVSTLRNWEQGRRKPEGAARVLLKVVSKNPKAVFNAIKD